MKLILLALFGAALCCAQDPPVKPEEPVARKEQPVVRTPEPAAKAPVAPKVVRLAAGDALPEFTLKDLAGVAHTSKDLLKDKKALVIDFWSNRCPTCKVNEARFAALTKEWGEKGVAVVHIASNRGEVADDKAVAMLAAAAKAEGIMVPILVDRGNVVADLLGASVTPTTYVIDATGKIRYCGALTDDPRNRKVTVDYIGDALSAVLAGKEPGITSSRPEG